MPVAARPDLLQTDPPLVSAADAARIARDCFGLDAQAKQLTGERDLNFLIGQPDGARHVLKIANAAEPSGILDFQISALLHLAGTDCAAIVPKVVLSTAGDRLARIEDRSGRPHRAYLLTYISGLPMANHEPWPEPQTVAGGIGGLLGRLDLALSGFRHPQQKRHLLWDLSLAAELREKLRFIEDTAMASLATEALDRFEQQALPILETLPRQVIHNDLNPHNLIAAATRPLAIAGIIDFGDMLEAPRVNDVAVAASYHFRDGSDAAATALVGAYQREMPLSEVELDLVPLLIGARSVLTIAISSWRGEIYPENRDYIRRNRPAALRTLSVLSGDGLPRMRQALHSVPAGSAST